jgi:hypothetical protein
VTGRWSRRALELLGLLAVVLVSLRLLRIHPDVPTVALAVSLVLAVAWLTVDTLATEGPSWEVHGGDDVHVAGADPGLATYRRILEDHLSAREPSPVLRDRLAALATQRLSRHHGLALGDPGSQERLGPDLTAVLSGPVRRLTPAELDTFLHRIEDL